MSFANVRVTATGSSPLQDLLSTNDAIVPGSEPSYQLCKLIYTDHPLGAKLVEKPITLAMSKPREISVPNSPEERVKEAFEKEWEKLRADAHIANVMKTARMYGIASVGLMAAGQPTDKEVDFTKLWKQSISFNIFDPLNTAGSLVLDQNPLAMDFQHTTDIVVNGKRFHRSRSCVMMNEDPIYIDFTTSAFGFVGRSVYQRSLFPLKSYIQTMVTDDMVARKAGVIVAMMKQAGSIIDNAMAKIFGFKRSIVKEAENDNVISIGSEDSIASIDLKNLEGPAKMARHNILENIASGAGMPAKLITEETFAEGFGEGTEDAKAIANYLDGFRKTMQPLYDYFDKIARYRAWNPDFYETIQADFPNYKGVTYETAFYQWTNSFSAKWPNFLKEPDSEMVKVDAVSLEAIIDLLRELLPHMDPENKVALLEFAQDNINAMKFLFKTPLALDFTALLEYVPPNPVVAGGEGDQGGDSNITAAADSAGGVATFRRKVAALGRTK